MLRKQDSSDWGQAAGDVSTLCRVPVHVYLETDGVSLPGPGRGSDAGQQPGQGGGAVHRQHDHLAEGEGRLAGRELFFLIFSATSRRLEKGS